VVAYLEHAPYAEVRLHDLHAPVCHACAVARECRVCVCACACVVQCARWPSCSRKQTLLCAAAIQLR
jgi:hypothetical protein